MAKQWREIETWSIIDMSSKKLEVRLNRQGHEMPYNWSIVVAIDMAEIYRKVDGV